MPLAAGVPVVTTLHDATFFTHPDVHLPVKRQFFRTWTRISLRRARALRDARRRPRGTSSCGSPARAPDRVDVAHLGVDARALPRAVRTPSGPPSGSTWA